MAGFLTLWPRVTEHAQFSTMANYYYFYNYYYIIKINNRKIKINVK